MASLQSCPVLELIIRSLDDKTLCSLWTTSKHFKREVDVLDVDFERRRLLKSWDAKGFTFRSKDSKAPVLPEAGMVVRNDWCSSSMFFRITRVTKKSVVGYVLGQLRCYTRGGSAPPYPPKKNA
jgi:hypothetical protein